MLLREEAKAKQGRGGWLPTCQMGSCELSGSPLLSSMGVSKSSSLHQPGMTRGQKA